MTRSQRRTRDRASGVTDARSRTRKRSVTGANSPKPAAPQPDAPIKAGLYDDPHIYDILHAPGTREELEVVADLADRYALSATPWPRRVWIEPACGTARHLRVALRSDHHTLGNQRDRVIGIDTNAPMLEFAQDTIERLHASDRAQLIEANITSFAHRARWKGTTGLCLVNSLRHLLTDRAVLAHLSEMAAALRSGGLYIVGMHMARYTHDAITRDVFTAKRGKIRLRQYVTCTPAASSKARRESIDSVLRVASPGRAELRHDRYVLRSYDMVQWAKLLARSAMRPIAVTDFQGDPLDIRIPWSTGDDGYRLWVLGRAQDTDGKRWLTPQAVIEAVKGLEDAQRRG